MLLIKNGRIKPMVGSDIECGCVLIGDDGKISAVGENIAESCDMTVIDAEGRLVTPGCVEAHCHIGVHNSAISIITHILNYVEYLLFSFLALTIKICTSKSV